MNIKAVFNSFFSHSSVFFSVDFSSVESSHMHLTSSLMVVTIVVGSCGPRLEMFLSPYKRTQVF